MKLTQEQMRERNIPICEKYGLNIVEASEYFGIGETKLREMINENPKATYILKNGKKTIIKRKQFEKYLDEQYVI